MSEETFTPSEVYKAKLLVEAAKSPLPSFLRVTDLTIASLKTPALAVFSNLNDVNNTSVSHTSTCVPEVN
jgi:hypothetical protein